MKTALLLSAALIALPASALAEDRFLHGAYNQAQPASTAAAPAGGVQSYSVQQDVTAAPMRAHQSPASHPFMQQVTAPAPAAAPQAYQPTQAPAPSMPAREALPCCDAPAPASRPSALHSDVLKVGVDRRVADAVFDFQEGTTDDAAELLQLRRAGAFEGRGFIVSAALRGNLTYEQTSEAGKFPLLSRLPNTTDADEQASFFTLQNASLGITASAHDWVTLHGTYQYSETEYAGDQDELQLRQAYAVIGNLNQSPVYAAIGRKTIDFGEFATFSPFTQSVGQHFYQAQSDEPVVEIGYLRGGLRASATVINGGRQLRVADAGQAGDIANFALKLKNAFDLGPYGTMVASASYLNDTIYRNNFTAHTAAALGRAGPPNAPAFPDFPVERKNGAVSLGLEYYSDVFDLAGEYIRSERPWVATSFDGVTGAKNLDNRALQAITASARLKGYWGDKPSALSATFSRGIIGPEDTEFDFTDQHSLGYELALTEAITLGSEIVYNRGFQPFVGVQDFADADVQSLATLFGIEARF